MFTKYYQGSNKLLGLTFLEYYNVLSFGIKNIPTASPEENTSLPKIGFTCLPYLCLPFIITFVVCLFAFHKNWTFVFLFDSAVN